MEFRERLLGAAQCVFLAALFARKRSAGTADRVASAALLAACVWQATSAITIFHRASAGRPDAVLLSGLDHLGTAALAVIPVLVLNLVMAWSAVRPAFITAVYLAVPTAWWALESGRTTFYGAWIATAFAVSSAVCAYAAWKAGLPPIPRRFLAAFAVTLFAVPAVGIGAGPDSAAFPVVCLGPPFGERP